MASSTSKPEKRLGEFLKEQQEPFVLEAYLLERGYSTPNGDSTNKRKKKEKKALFPFSKVLTALHIKLTFHNQSSTSTVMIKNSSDTRTKHANLGVRVPHIEAQSVDQTVVETDRFSTASSSTMFNSCSDIDEDDTSLSSHNNALFSSDTGDQSQQDTKNGKHCQRCLEVSVTHETLNKDVSVWGIEQRIDCCGVIVPKKLTEDSLLSAALWSSIINTAKREMYDKELREFLGHDVSDHALKSKKVLRMHRTKQLLFDCVKEITINVPRKDDRQKGCKQFMGPEKMGKIIWDWEETKEWSQRAGNETNLTTDLDSINEWSSKFKPQVEDIGVEIADAILEQVNDEITSEMIEFEIL